MEFSYESLLGALTSLAQNISVCTRRTDNWIKWLLAQPGSVHWFLSVTQNRFISKAWSYLRKGWGEANRICNEFIVLFFFKQIRSLVLQDHRDTQELNLQQKTGYDTWYVSVTALLNDICHTKLTIHAFSLLSNVKGEIWVTMTVQPSRHLVPGTTANVITCHDGIWQWTTLGWCYSIEFHRLTVIHCKIPQHIMRALWNLP